MPSIDADTFGMPLAKRQKVATEKNVALQNQTPASRIFSPFRVRIALFLITVLRVTNGIAFIDPRFGLSYASPVHFSCSGKDDVPNHNLCRTMPADIRSPSRTQLGLLE